MWYTAIEIYNSHLWKVKSRQCLAVQKPHLMTFQGLFHNFNHTVNLLDSNYTDPFKLFQVSTSLWHTSSHH